MEHLLLNPDLLRVARLSADAARSELFEQAEGESGELILRPEAPSILARKILDRMEQERKDKLGQGIKQRSVQIETVVKPLFEKYGVESEDIVQGITDLTEKIKLLEKEKPSLADLKDDEVVRLPAFQRALNEQLASARQTREELQNQFDAFKQAVERDKTDSYVFGHVETALTKANAAFAPNRAAQLRHFFNGLEKDYFHIDQATGGIDLLDKDGIAIRGANKEMMTFEEYVISKWKELGYGINDANPAPPSPGRPGEKTTSFTSSAQVQEAIRTEKDPNRKRELMAKASELLRSGK